MCRIDYCDGLWKRRASIERVARREHECSECGRLIHSGETYEYFRGLWSDGQDEWVTVKTCLHCVIARGWLMSECGGWIYTEVLDELREHWEEDTIYRAPSLGRLIIGMRRKWQQRDGSLMPVPV
jgi:hypothetical protein